MIGTQVLIVTNQAEEGVDTEVQLFYSHFVPGVGWVFDLEETLTDGGGLAADVDATMNTEYPSNDL